MPAFTTTEGDLASRLGKLPAMKIAYLTAGAAGMYCGTCMHDNTLATRLIAKGHEVALLPLYTPMRTDEESVANERIFYGAINIFLQQKVPFFRHTPRLVDWIFDRPRLLTWVSRFASSTDARMLGEMTLATLQGEDGPQHKELEKLVDWLATHKRPDVVCLSHTLFLGFAPRLRQVLGVPVLSALQGEDIFFDELEPPYRQQVLDLIRERAVSIDAFISPCREYSERMGELLELPEERLHVVPLGIDTAGFGPGEGGAPAGDGSQVTIGYLARICPEKGLHLLLDAFHELAAEPGGERLRLRIAGYLGERDHAYADEQRRRIESSGLGDQIDWVGEVDRAGKQDFLRDLDLFALPTVYREPKGLSAIEALASGVPVVLPRHGTFPELIEEAGGGLLVEPGSATALANGLRELIDDPARRRELGERGRASVLESRNADLMAERTLEVFRSVDEASTKSRTAESRVP